MGIFVILLEDFGDYPQTRAVLSFAPLLMVRPGELVKTKWQEIDWDGSELHISAERMKMRRKHIVPLCRQPLAVMEVLKLFTGNGELLFPSRNDQKRTISIESLTVAIQAMGFTRDKLHVYGLRSCACS